jgi:hypothetical protein
VAFGEQEKESGIEVSRQKKDVGSRPPALAFFHFVESVDCEHQSVSVRQAGAVSSSSCESTGPAPPWDAGTTPKRVWI